MKHFDLIVIGAGSGLDVAVEAADRGMKTALIEEGPLGGTCLNRGCIPSKIIIHSADVADTINDSARFGINSKITKINFKKVTDRANKTVDADSRNIKKGISAENNPHLFTGKAKFAGKKIIQIGKEKLTAKKIVIAAGARSFVPLIKGLDKVPYLTSTEALRQTKLPKSMIIIGGGYIGVELGHFYAALGCKITIVQRGPLLIPREDKDVAELFTKIWQKKYNLITVASADKVEKKKGKILVTVKIGNKERIVSAEKLLVAVGVRPNSDRLQLEKTGVKINERGFIKVNRYLETNVRGIYALGDIAGVYLFKHSANQEAEYLVRNLFQRKKAVDYYPMPHAIFTQPQVAGVGVTEQEAQEQAKNYVVGKYNYIDTGMGEASGDKEGFVKFIVDKKSKEILGCHILGHEASTLLHQVLIAMKAGKKKALSLLQETIYVHPALNEVVQRAALNVRI